MAYAFISHAIEADGAVARQLAADLRRHRVKVWIAPDSIPDGEQWAEHIDRALTECGFFVLVLTPAALRSRWVQTETRAAIALKHQGKIDIVPLDVEACDVSSVSPTLGTFQQIPFRQSYDAGVRRLLKRLGVPDFEPRPKDRPTPAFPLLPELDEIDVGPDANRYRFPSASEIHELARVIEEGRVLPGREDEQPAKTPAIQIGSGAIPPWEAFFEANDQAMKGDEARKLLDYDAAIRHYTKAIECFPAEPWGIGTRKTLGSVHHRRGECRKQKAFMEWLRSFEQATRGPALTWDPPSKSSFDRNASSRPSLRLSRLPRLAPLSPTPTPLVGADDFARARELGYRPPEDEPPDSK